MLKNVTILILIDGFLQCEEITNIFTSLGVTILILIDGFLQLVKKSLIYSLVWGVTILILIDGFLQ